MGEDGKPTDKTDDTGKEAADVPASVHPKSEVEQVKDTLAELKTANDEVEKELLRKEELRAKVSLGGQSEAGQSPPEKKAPTNLEYAESLERGEVNPLKEDGLI